MSDNLVHKRKVSDKMTYANSADPEQTAPEGAVVIRIYTVCYSTK